jgi:hypothetical protein
MDVTAPANVGRLGQSDEVVQCLSSAEHISQANGEDGPFQGPFGPQVRVSTLFDDWVRLAKNRHRRIVPASPGFTTNTNKAELDVRPRCQRMIPKTELSLSSNKQAVALFQISARQFKLSPRVQHGEPHLTSSWRAISS